MRWPKVALGEVCIVDWGNTSLTKSAYVVGGEYLAVSATGGDGRINHWEHKALTPVVSAIGAQCGKLFLPKEDFTAIKNTITLTPMRDKHDQESCCPLYLYHLLSSMQLPRRGAGQPFISKGDLQEFNIPLPPLEEQRRIAAVLDKAENIHSLLKAQNAVAESFMQSAFIDLFGNPKEEPRNSLFSVTTLGECCALFSGGTLPGGEENTGQEGGFLLLKVSDMNLPGNEERIKTSRLWASSPGAKSATCPAGSVVIPKRGGAIGTNKKRVVDRDAVLDPNLMAIAPGDQAITTEFLRGWFSFLDLSSITSGSSVPQLNKQDLLPLRIVVPPLQSQEGYKELAIRAIAMSDRLQKQSARSHALLAALQHKFLSGNHCE